jgi:hypothetical protein
MRNYGSHIRGGNIEEFADLRQVLAGHISLLALGDVEQRHHGRALLVRRVLRQDRVDLLAVALVQRVHRSVSPNTMSMLPMMATRSAT